MKVKVWDGGVRLFHWVLVILFTLSAYSAFQDKFGIYADIHIYSGVAILTLVIWRILWGIVGSDTARFSHFVRGPGATLRYLGKAFRRAPYTRVGHNPLGAVSVALLLMLLLAQPILGLYGTDAMFFEGPLAHTIDSDLAEGLTEIHEWIGYTLLGLVGLHLLAIAAYALIRRANLISPMITGKKQVAQGTAAPKMRSPFLALGLFVIVAAGVWFSVF
ncbi:cytochrome b/b6 domain-containing protein [Kordiimonas aestuarii]|uniref:cytochrome b/b6 domain-containing protein n=1 Tax=Kordiimonas aestuarii TaxID=1005925 RepID=UPI0021CEC121|nr:cytochrome b/b6 domain-containing protein [Kordiimonas aestuarii]